MVTGLERLYLKYKIYFPRYFSYRDSSQQVLKKHIEQVCFFIEISRLFIDLSSFTFLLSLLAWEARKDQSSDLRTNRQMLAQLAEQDGVDAGHLLALAGHVLRVHLGNTFGNSPNGSQNQPAHFHHF